MRDLNIEYSTIKFDGSFFEDNIYRQQAGSEVDEAWRALGIQCKSTLFLRRCNNGLAVDGTGNRNDLRTVIYADTIQSR